MNPFSLVDLSNFVLMTVPSVLKNGWSAGLAIVVAGALSDVYSRHMSQADLYTEKIYSQLSQCGYLYKADTSLRWTQLAGPGRSRDQSHKTLTLEDIRGLKWIKHTKDSMGSQW